MRIYNDLVYSNTVSITDSSLSFTLQHMYGFSVQAVFTNATPSNTTFVDADVNTGTDTITKAAHGLVTGLAVTLTTTGVLPTGLALATTYYIIRLTSSTYQFASSVANALAGTPVDITAAAGGGTHTVNVTALSATAGLQVTNDDATDPTVVPNWDDLAIPASVTATGSQIYNFDGVHYAFARFKVTVTSGQLTVAARVNGKGV